MSFLYTLVRILSTIYALLISAQCKTARVEFRKFLWICELFSNKAKNQEKKFLFLIKTQGKT